LDRHPLPDLTFGTVRVYLDTNAVQAATRIWPSARALEDALGTSEYELAFGGHVFYELARAFTSPKSRNETRDCLRILADMDRIYYVPQPQELINGEVDQARFGGKVLHRVSKGYSGTLRLELRRLAAGDTGEAERFIAKREAELKAGHVKIAEANYLMVREYVLANPQARKRMKTFDGFKEEMRPLWRRFITKRTGPLSGLITDRILRWPQNFPVINTWLNVQLYLSFLSSRSTQPPSAGRLDDYRNAIESNAANLFVTNDKKLLRVYPVINPFCPLDSWDSFYAILRSPR
jgi:hypothetical protein